MVDFFYDWKREDVWKIIEPTVTESEKAAVKAEFENLLEDQKSILGCLLRITLVLASSMIRDGGPDCSMNIDSICGTASPYRIDIA